MKATEADFQDPTAESVADAIPSELRGAVRHEAQQGDVALAYRFWEAAGPGDSAVYLHGIAGHSLWFSAAAARLAERGIAVYAPDRRGSGLNRELGPGHVASYTTVLRDVERFVRLARRERPNGKVFLLAGCWGAKAGAVFAARAGHLIDGLALIAPALSVRVTLPPRDLLGVALSLLVSPRRHFRIPLEPEQYTANQRFRSFVAADQQRLLTASARFFFETARLDRLAAKAPPSIRVPVLLLCGGRDAIVDPAGLQAWYARLAAEDRTVKIYPEFAHILEFEDRRDEYLSDLLEWLGAHSSERSAAARQEVAEGRHADRPD